MKYLALASAFLLPSAALAVTEAQLIEAAKREGGKIHASSNFLPYGRIILEEFQRTYPFISVKHTQFIPTIPGYEDFLENEDKEQRFDIMMRCQDKDLDHWLPPQGKALASLADLPNWAKRSRRAHTSDRYVFFLGAPHVIAYNPKHISESDLPTSYEDLLTPKWRGKVVVRSPLKGNSAAFLNHYFIATRGVEWLKRLGANGLHVSQSALTLHELVQNGTFPIGLSRDVEVLHEKRFPDLKFKTIGNELPMQYQLAVMFANAPHPATARLFINWLISDEATAFLESKGYTVGKRHDEAVAGKTWYWHTQAITFPQYRSNLYRALRMLRAGGANVDKEETAQFETTELPALKAK